MLTRIMQLGWSILSFPVDLVTLKEPAVSSPVGHGGTRGTRVFALLLRQLRA